MINWNLTQYCGSCRAPLQVTKKTVIHLFEGMPGFALLRTQCLKCRRYNTLIPMTHLDTAYRLQCRQDVHPYAPPSHLITLCEDSLSIRLVIGRGPLSHHDEEVIGFLHYLLRDGSTTVYDEFFGPPPATL